MCEIEALLTKKVRELTGDPIGVVAADTPLLGEDGLLDSMNLVRLCLELEEAAEQRGFEFDWTSDSVLSRSRSFLRDIRSLVTEFEAQKAAQ
jgi:hypothetical protein